MKFLNIFNKKQKEKAPAQDDTDLLAAVTFSIDKTGEMYVDINMEDFDDQSIVALASIVSMISTVKCQLSTIDMIKNAFFQEGKVQEYLKLVTEITVNTQDYLDSMQSRSGENEPYIKPSDMM
jgi:hypothetical protein